MKRISARANMFVMIVIGLMTVSISAQTHGLGGTSWQLIKIQSSDDTTVRPDDKSKYTITFSLDGRLSALIDCNRGSGMWTSSGPNRLQFGPMAVTYAMCPPGSLHDRILKDWSHVRSYVIKDGHLFLSLMADGGIHELERIGGSSEESSLFGKRWKLTEVNGVAVKTTKPYIEFNKTGRFSADGGCNRIAGRFELSGMQNKFSQAISTRRACIDAELQQVETNFLKGLEETTSFQIQNEELRFFNADRPVLTFRADPNASSDSGQERVTGTITYRQRIALSPNAVIEVKLLDISRADAPSVTIAEQTLKPAGKQVPIAFELQYEPARIDTRRRYAIQVRIYESSQLRFINSQAYPVITAGHPKTVNVIVTPARP